MSDVKMQSTLLRKGRNSQENKDGGAENSGTEHINFVL